VNRAKADGGTPLYIAARNGHVAVAKLLLMRGAAVNPALIADSWTPLLIAAYKGHVEVAELLLERGAAMNQATVSGGTPLYIAAQEGHLAIAKLLLGWEAAVNRDKVNYVQSSLFIAARNSCMAVIERLLGRGATVNKATFNGATPLYIAAWKGHVAMVELLLGRGAAAEQALHNGITPLVVALEGHPAVAVLLDASLTARAAARAGRVSFFRDAAEAGAFPAPIAQWITVLAPAARAELSAWAFGRLTDERACFAALFRGPLVACRALQKLRGCDDLRRLLLGYLVAPSSATRHRAS